MTNLLGNRQAREGGRNTYDLMISNFSVLILDCCTVLDFQPSDSIAVIPASPTTVTQMSLSNPTMLRTHSLSNADGQYDPYTDSRFRNSSMSLDEKSRTMSRSGSFRDGFEEGKEMHQLPGDSALLMVFYVRLSWLI